MRAAFFRPMLIVKQQWICALQLLWFSFSLISSDSFLDKFIVIHFSMWKRTNWTIDQHSEFGCTMQNTLAFSFASFVHLETLKIWTHTCDEQMLNPMVNVFEFRIKELKSFQFDQDINAIGTQRWWRTAFRFTFLKQFDEERKTLRQTKIMVITR